MKLQSITLVNFGVYAQHTFQFDAAPVVLVYGQNESGKTTALNGASKNSSLNTSLDVAQVHGADDGGVKRKKVAGSNVFARLASGTKGRLSLKSAPTSPPETGSDARKSKGAARK